MSPILQKWKQKTGRLSKVVFQHDSPTISLSTSQTLKDKIRGLGTTKNNVLSQRLEQTLFDGLLFHSIIEEFQKQTDVYFVFELAGALALVSLQ